MTMWRCARCRRTGEPTDARLYWNTASFGEPGYHEDACRICAPSSEDEERARDAHWDRKIDEAREKR